MAEKLIEMLTNVYKWKTETTIPAGVKEVTIEYPWGIQVRYGIPKKAWLEPEEWRPGLWSFEKMREITGFELPPDVPQQYVEAFERFEFPIWEIPDVETFQKRLKETLGI